MTVSPPRKKLIEVSIPLEAINKASAREKSIRHGHPSTLHLWWARRPLAACRAVLFSQLVDDPSAWPDKFPTEADQETERLRLHRVIEKMVPWEASNDEAILNDARWEIARSVAWGAGEEPPAKGDGKAILAYLQEKAPPVYDPFSGGGSIPLEAQRLGLRAYGSDLNPVAVLIGKSLVEIPPKFAGMPPVNPNSQREIKRFGHWNGRGGQGLAEDVHYYGRRMRDKAAAQIGHLYPTATLEDGSEATVIAWLWARTVRSPDPAAKGAMVPLASSFILSGKMGRKAWVDVVIDPASPDGWRFEVLTGNLDSLAEARLKNGTKTGRGASFSCALTGTAISEEHIRSEFQSKRASSRMMAIVADGPTGRTYLSPTSQHTAAALSASPTWRPDIEMEQRSSNLISGRGYGFTHWHEIFTPRQQVALTTFADLVSDMRQEVIADAMGAGLVGQTPLADGGDGAVAYGDAVATYLAFTVDRAADRNCTICTWDSGPSGTKASTGGSARTASVRNVFARQAIPMTWDFAESNIFSESGGGVLSALEWIEPVLKQLSFASGSGEINSIDASKNSFPARSAVFSTDPPYYDNIAYADLSDFFYIWLRRSLGAIWPDLFRRLVTPKDDELVASSYRHGSRGDAEAFFMKGMSEALTAMRAATHDHSPLTIYYAFKQSETAEEGVTSAGWASFLQAVFDAGLAVDGTWPMRTELSNRMIGKGTNALASSIVLVCRKRMASAPDTDVLRFTAALRRDLPASIAKIRAAGVGPVDMQQSIIGPGMGVFTRYSEVLQDDDTRMSVKTALSIINRVWQEIDNEIVATFDPATQVALAWFASYGFDPKPSGDLITLANAKDTAITELFDAGVFEDMKGRSALTSRDKLDPHWSPARDRMLTVWECVQHLARALNAEGGGAQEAARLIAEMGPKATDARALLDRLFQIATDKGWAQEALVYNQLAEEWPHLLERSANISNELRPAQTGDLFA